jgi:hypothetical protein
VRCEGFLDRGEAEERAEQHKHEDG